MRINPNMTNGKFCMTEVCEFIKDMRKDINVDDFCNEITARINGIYKAYGINMTMLKNEPVMRMTSSVVVYSKKRREIWMVGDCQCMINGVLHENTKPCEKLVAEKRAAIICKALDNGATVAQIQDDDIGRRAIEPDLKESCKMQNIDYSVVDGFPIPLSKVKVIRLEDNPAEIVLASDGYPNLKPTLEESECELNRILSEDPLCIKLNVATKGLAKGRLSFDDRTYIRFVD